MCGLCGLFGVGGHWTDGPGGSLGARERQQRTRAVNRVLAGHGLSCADWQGRLVLTGPTGKRAVVDHMGALWPAAEALAGRAIDPLDPAVIARMEAA